MFADNVYVVRPSSSEIRWSIAATIFTIVMVIVLAGLVWLWRRYWNQR